ncbi:MAG: sulfatase-like hydrolase/transferase [Caulobacteraceae bacterium]|nr:sulfatase-like hydrolase/transferase [Caulobacteraceae bacterium]
MTFRLDGKSFRKFLGLLGVFLMLGTAACQPKHTPSISPRSQNETRPNILLFVADALGPELGAYGDRAALTPNIDALAREGVTYVNAYGASGSSGAAWAAMLTGMYPQTLGVIQDWNGPRGWNVAPQPEVKAFPELLRRAGYFTFRVGPKNDPFGGTSGLWDDDERGAGVTWPSIDVPQPFLGVIEATTLPLDDKDAPKPKKKGFFENLFAKKEKPVAPPSIDAARIVAPPYLPDTPAVRAALKARYQRIALLDRQVGEAVARLKQTGALSNTIIIVTARTGAPWPRGERTLYDSGVRTPLIVRYPDGRGRGSVNRALFSGVDLSPSIVSLARQRPMAWVQGRDRLSARPAPPASFAFSIQNRVGAVFERARAVRDGRYLFILNATPKTRLWDLARRGDLYDAVQGQGGAAPSLGPNQTNPRAEIELYDLRADPAQMRNLAADAGHVSDVQRLRAALIAFNGMTPDLSFDSTSDLRDRYQPAGQTPVTAPPVLRLVGNRVVMEALTPGSTIEWRLRETDRWTLYRGPVPLPKGGKLQAKSSRYGFTDSDPQLFDARKEKRK